jgi:hypothetical protein
MSAEFENLDRGNKYLSGGKEFESYVIDSMTAIKFPNSRSKIDLINLTKMINQANWTSELVLA